MLLLVYEYLSWDSLLHIGNPQCDILTVLTMADQTAVTYYGAPQIIIVRYLLVPVPGDYYPGKYAIVCYKTTNNPVFG